MKILLGMLIVLGLGAMGGMVFAAEGSTGAGKEDGRVFELRIYHAAPGKMEALETRFRDHTLKLFKKHGMTVVGFWRPTDPKESDKKLIYILEFPSREAAEKSWKGFRDDAEWKTVRAASEKDGTLVTKVESTFMKATDYSPIK